MTNGKYKNASKCTPIKPKRKVKRWIRVERTVYATFVKVFFFFNNNGVSNGVHGNGRTPFSTHNYSTSTSYYQQWTFLQEVPVPRRREQMLQNGEPSPPRMVLVS